jgi:hypothetical protein
MTSLVSRQLINFVQIEVKEGAFLNFFEPTNSVPDTFQGRTFFLEIAMNAISNIYMRTISETHPSVHPLKIVALVCGMGFAASLCVASYGLDIGS